MQISINANRCEPSPMRKFHPYALEAEKAGKKIYHLNIGQPDLPTPPAYYEAVRQFGEKTLGYDASPGNPLLIEAVRNYYKQLNVNLKPEDILIIDPGDGKVKTADEIYSGWYNNTKHLGMTDNNGWSLRVYDTAKK